jgi:uncharacterized membrane-anchored protein YitT (DUF2179 family)
MTSIIRRAIFLVYIIGGAFLVAAGLNTLLIPHQLLSGGVSGISMLLGYLTGLNIGWLYFVLNAPLFIWGWVAVGKRFVLLSFLSVTVTTIFLQLLPQVQFNKDPLIASVFGGVLVGIGAGISFRAGGSTGGFDIVGSILTRHSDFPLGLLLFSLNAVVIVLLGITEHNWDLALYSMISIFVSGRMVDTIHIRRIKVTAFIVTSRKDELVERLMRMPRGVTVIKAEGAYTHTEKYMLMTVTNRYELAELQKNIREVDPQAFVNIVETAGVMGLFRRE